MLASMKFGGPELVGFVVAVSFAAGLNVYATVATLGLLAHAGWVDLPSGLHLLTSWWVICASGALFAVEFFADKIPAFDLVWNALHTFVPVPVAAHCGKTAARVAVTPSPEPVSNIALSAGEDTLAIFLTWFATQHPVIAASIVAVFLAAIMVAIRAVVGAVKKLFRSANDELVSEKRADLNAA
jgi:hypothetical protein